MLANSEDSLLVSLLEPVSKVIDDVYVVLDSTKRFLKKPDVIDEIDAAIENTVCGLMKPGIEIVHHRLSKDYTESIIKERCNSLFMRIKTNDTDIILERTNFGSDASCQRAILELCALMMTDFQRREVVGKLQDEMYRLLRQPKVLLWQLRFFSRKKEEFVDMKLCDRIMKQQWFKVADLGQLKTINALYHVISANPQAFYQMVAKADDRKSHKTNGICLLDLPLF